MSLWPMILYLTSTTRGCHNVLHVEKLALGKKILSHVNALTGLLNQHLSCTHPHHPMYHHV